MGTVMRGQLQEPQTANALAAIAAAELELRLLHARRASILKIEEGPPPEMGTRRLN